MKHTKIIISILMMLAVSAVCSPAWASSVTLWHFPETISIEEAGFRLEAPADLSSRAVSATVTASDYSKIIPVDEFFVTSAVDIRMLDVKRTSMDYLAKPVRLVFSFNDIDFKRASRLNTSLSIGHFRIGYWDEAENNWVELPSQIFWNGVNGAVEAETNRGSGRYALIWSYQEGTQLSPSAEEGIRIMVNLVTIRPDAAPYIKDGRTMVPFRVIAENLDAHVNWIASEKRIDLIRNTDKLQLWIGQPEALMNNDNFTLDVAPEIVNGRTFVPLRFVAEALGAKATWDSLTRTVKIQNTNI